MNLSSRKLNSTSTWIILGLSCASRLLGQTSESNENKVWTSSLNSSIESAFVSFSGDQKSAKLYSLALSTTGNGTSDTGSSFSSQVSLSGTVIDANSPDAYGVQKQTRERRGSVGLTGVINKLTSLGTSFGYSIVDKVNTWSSLRLGQWWNKATVATDLEILTTHAKRNSRDYLDTDGSRVLTPSYVKGKRYTLSMTWLATTRAILLGSVSTATSSDRPKSHAETIEGRYFFDSTLTAIHLKAGSYTDMKRVDKTTDYGRITAKEWEAQVHQHLSDRVIGSFVARDSFETEEARSSETADIHRHGRSTQGRFRYRFVSGPVTDSVSEVYFFSGKYTSIDKSQSLSHLGMGGIYVF